MWILLLTLVGNAQIVAEKPALNIEALLENKISAVHSRRNRKLAGLRELRDAKTIESKRQALRTLTANPTLVRESELLSVWPTLPLNDPFIKIDLIKLISRHGDRASRQNLLPQLGVPRSYGSAAGYQEAGPWLVLPKDEPNFRGLAPLPDGQSDWSKPEWLFDRRGWIRPELAFYSHAIRNGTIGGVLYRDVEFRVGDLVLLSHELPKDGFITSVMAPRQYATHMGVYTEFEVVTKGDTFQIPVVLEIFERGMRIVPLHQYVGENFARIAEVWRLKPEHTPPNYQKKIKKAAVDLLNTPMGYDFLSVDFTDAEVAMDALPIERRFGTCATTTDYLLRKVGVDLSGMPRDKVSDGWKGNLALWNNPMTELLTPQGFIESGKFDLVGTIDNDALDTLILSELIFGAPSVPGTLPHLIATQDFNMNALDYPFVLGLASLLPVSWDEFLGGLPSGTFPRASMEVLRLLWMANAVNTDSFNSMRGDPDFMIAVGKLAGEDRFSILEFERSKLAQTLRERHMVLQRSWFNPRSKPDVDRVNRSR